MIAIAILRGIRIHFLGHVIAPVAVPVRTPVVDGGAFAIGYVIAEMPGTGAVEGEVARVEAQLNSTGHVACVVEEGQSRSCCSLAGYGFLIAEFVAVIGVFGGDFAGEVALAIVAAGYDPGGGVFV